MHHKFIIALSLLAFLGLQTLAVADEWRTHVVSGGENLTEIANRYGVTVHELMNWNELDDDQLLVGQKLLLPDEEREWYTIRRGDTLSKIAERFNMSVTDLKRLNDLRGSRIYPGRKLRLRAADSDAVVYVVRRGDSLSRIAGRHGTSVFNLKRINDLSRDRIYVGQKLRLRAVARSVHVVERGDALWEIAQAYGLTVSRLKDLNGLTSDRIYPGQALELDGEAAPAPAVYTVRRGDNLNEIARLHQMSLRELRDLNGIRGSLIHPGQSLKVRPLLGAHTAAPDAQTAQAFDWEHLTVAISGVHRIDTGNGPYYYEGPRARHQHSKTYKEESSISPLVSYRHARKLINRFDEVLATMPPLSHRLDGWHFVLDPGHGGIDPGAIVAGKDAQGGRFFIVEDEVVYDLSLRIYAPPSWPARTPRGGGSSSWRTRSSTT